MDKIFITCTAEVHCCLTIHKLSFVMANLVKLLINYSSIVINKVRVGLCNKLMIKL